MRAWSYTAATLSLHALVRTCAGYYVDPQSCSGAQGTFVQEMLHEAFAMINVLVANAQEQPMNSWTTQLVATLFGVQGVDNAANLILKVDTFAPDLTQAEHSGLGSLFQIEDTSLAALTSNDVAIFCNPDRLDVDPDVPASWWDNTVEVSLPINDYCNHENPDLSFMYSWTLPDHFDVIQICPWFLEWAMSNSVAYKTADNVAGVIALFGATDLNRYLERGATDIDLYSLFGKTMLHEFMHTKAGGQKTDVNRPNSYGWNVCTAMAADGSGVNNADSYAILASANWWRARGKYIVANGNFALSPSTPWNENSKRWLGSGPAKAGERSRQYAGQRVARNATI